ncbi:hypothetical protein [Halorubrum distributum]|uniref:hypothetical protein n=1 Tax=Halorubrum distributum TaxID=29283 RepID=UPI00126806AC|nr:hypothetical protein [Halorubrum arcis]
MAGIPVSFWELGLGVVGFITLISIIPQVRSKVWGKFQPALSSIRQSFRNKVAASSIPQIARPSWWYIWSGVFFMGRSVRAWSTTVSAIGTVLVILVGIWIGLEPIVLVTLFYATALFFTNFLHADRPFPIVSFSNEHYGPTYGEQNGRGFLYELSLRNTGTVSLVDPTIEYRIFDSDFNEVRNNENGKWIQHSITNGEECILDPGEEITLEIEQAPIKHDDDTDYHLWIKASPRSQYREVTLLHSLKIKGEKAGESTGTDNDQKNDSQNGER